MSFYQFLVPVKTLSEFTLQRQPPTFAFGIELADALSSAQSNDWPKL